MKKCSKCANSFFIAEEDRGVEYIICTSCKSVVGTVNPYDLESGINEITGLLTEQNTEMTQSLEKLISNQAIINDKLDKILKDK